MSTCKDCVHYEICEIMSDQYGISKVPSSQCGFYKNTADVVAVVRCKDCKHRDSGRMSCQGRHPDWYCPKGERREG